MDKFVYYTEKCKDFQFSRTTCCIIGQHALRRKENPIVLAYNKFLMC